MRYMVILGLEFENTIVIFEISAREFVSMQSLMQKWKSLNLEQKMPYLDILGKNFKKLPSYLKPALSNLSKMKF